MRIVMTLMVRDEADIVEAMLEHHFAQGVDHIIATDNASVDGTTEILQSYANRGLVTLHFDPRHEKQQAEVVTAMARQAAIEHKATWVLNADADEFWVAENPAITLREALLGIPTSFRAFDVPVIDMIGEPALEGSGLTRLIYRDQRSIERIHALGLHAHATHDVAFVADPAVEVAQGNHFVNIASRGRPEPGQGIEVLHLPWRSWKQFSSKVRKTGEAYDRSGLTPSPNHHGMRDYRRLREGRLFPLYLARHPDQSEIAAAPPGALVSDIRLAATLQNPVPDLLIASADWRAHALLAGPLLQFEREIESAAIRLNGQIVESQISAQSVGRLVENISAVFSADLAQRDATALVLREKLDFLENSRTVRMSRALRQLLFFWRK